MAKSKIIKVELNARLVDIDFNSPKDITKIGLHEIDLTVTADVDFLINLCRFLEKETGTKIE